MYSEEEEWFRNAKAAAAHFREACAAVMLVSFDGGNAHQIAKMALETDPDPQESFEAKETPDERT